MRLRLAAFISIIQSILFLGHLFIYMTWASFWGGYAASSFARIALALLSVSFVTASLLGWYSHNPLVRFYYVFAAAWLGLSGLLLCASVLCWVVWGFSAVLRLAWSPAIIADVLNVAAVMATACAIVNAAWLRTTHITVQLAHLPEHWTRRTAALVSDTHVGHVRNARFVRRVVRKLAELEPHVVFLAGDLYDGTAADFEKLAQPWAEFIASRPGVHRRTAQTQTRTVLHRGDAEARRETRIRSDTAVMEPGEFLGVYYILGNHEEFYSHAEYMPPLARAGVRALDNEKVELDGVQLVGIHYRDAIDEQHYRHVLRNVRIDRHRPSILLLHAPVRLHMAEEEGVSLQLSGHTHGGQFFPGTLIAKRVWGRFVHGLERLGNLQVFISYGAGTWGPPMRLGTRPEIVLITFEPAES